MIYTDRHGHSPTGLRDRFRDCPSSTSSCPSGGYRFNNTREVGPQKADTECGSTRADRRGAETQMGEAEGRGEEKRLIAASPASMVTSSTRRRAWRLRCPICKSLLILWGVLPGGWGRDWPGVVTPAHSGREGGQKRWSLPTAGSKLNGELGSGLFRGFLCPLCSLLRSFLCGELLFHLGRDGLGVHFVGAGGIAEHGSRICP